MQVKIEDKTTVKKVLSFEIPEKTVAKELDEAYKELKKTADIKGFRKGKIPRKVLENRFSKDVHSNIASRLIQDSFLEAIQEHKLEVVGSPQMDPPDLEPKADYTFEMTVEVKPVIDDVEYEGLSLEKNMYKVSDAEVDSQIYMIRKTLAKKKTVEEERPIKDSDYVMIDYEGFLNGEAFDQTPKIENYVMAIKNTTMPKEFSEKLVGVIPPQDLEIEVVYPEDHFEENLAGKTVLYKLTVKEIQEEVLPEADDDLVKDLGQFETLEDVKVNIRENLTKGIEQRVHQEMSEQVFTHLLEKYEFEVPDIMVDAELDGIIMETEQAYAQNNMTLESVGMSRDKLKENYRDVAEKQARRHLILEKIIRQESMDLTEDELDESFERMAQGMNASVDAVKNYFKMDPKQLEYYKHTELEKKAVRLIIEKGQVTEVEPKEPESEPEEASPATESEAEETKE